MAIAMSLGGYTATEADLLRRTMGNIRKKTRLEAALERSRSGCGCAASRRERETAKKICEDLRELRELWIS